MNSLGRAKAAPFSKAAFHLASTSRGGCSDRIGLPSGREPLAGRPGRGRDCLRRKGDDHDTTVSQVVF